jgi:hypothetical protein
MHGAVTDRTSGFAYCTQNGLLRVGGKETRRELGISSKMEGARTNDVVGLLLDLRGKESTLSVYTQDRTSWDSGGVVPTARLLGTVKCLKGPICWMVVTQAAQDMVQIGGRRSDPPLRALSGGRGGGRSI